MLNRKNAHLYYSHRLTRRGDFENYRIKTIEPCGLSVGDLDIKTEFLGRKIFPNYINAITGGTELSKKINKRLVKMAKFLNVPIMTGSLNPFIKNDCFVGFEPFLDYDFVIANLSARNSIDDLKKVSDKLQTPYVSLHLNTMQECFQFAGDTSFKNEAKNIEDAVKIFGDNLIIKGVGQGFSKESIHILKELGVKNLDISGAGGTDFSKIEILRSKSLTKGVFVDDCDDVYYPQIPTSESILNAKDSGMYIIASGGIDNAKDIFMSLALGANMTASAYYYLNLAKSSFNDARDELNLRLINLKRYMMISSSKTIADIKNKYEVIKWDWHHYHHPTIQMREKENLKSNGC